MLYCCAVKGVVTARGLARTNDEMVSDEIVISPVTMLPEYLIFFTQHHNLTWGQSHWNWHFNSEIEIGVLFLKLIEIGENVIGIFSYFSMTFSITSCNFLTQIIHYK